MPRRRLAIALALSACILVIRAMPGHAADRARGDAPAGVAYASAVLRYLPAYSDSCVPTDPDHLDPLRALGPPDYSSSSGTGAVSLGSGGLLELLFGGAEITNSGDSRTDLYIAEVGSSDEAFYVALRPALPTTPQDLIDLGLRDDNMDGFFELGRNPGGTACYINLDARFNRPVRQCGVRFDAVQIIDDLADHPTCDSSVGADIDAVEASLIWLAVAPASWGSMKVLYRD